MNNFFPNGTLLFNLNLTLLALLGAIMAIIPSFSSLNRKSIQLKSVFPFWLFIIIIVSLNLCFLYLSETYINQFLESQYFQIQKNIIKSFDIINFVTLSLFIIFVSFIPHLIEPVRLLEKICKRLPKTFPTLKKDIDNFWKSQLSYYNLDLYIKRTITVVDFIRRNKELQEISGLYFDIIIHGDYIQQRKASKVMIEKFKKAYKPEYDNIYNWILIPILVNNISHSLSHNINWSFYVEIFDEIGFLLRYISKNKQGLAFDNSADLLKNTYKEIFRKHREQIIEPIDVIRILRPYFICLKIECQNSKCHYFSGMIDLLEEISNKFGCEYLSITMFTIDNYIRDLLLKSEDIYPVKCLLDKLKYLCSQNEIASCQFHNNSSLAILLFSMRRIQDDLVKTGDEISIKKCTLIATFIKQQIEINKRYIAIATDEEGMKDIKNGYSKNKCKT